MLFLNFVDFWNSFFVMKLYRAPTDSEIVTPLGVSWSVNFMKKDFSVLRTLRGVLYKAQFTRRLTKGGYLYISQTTSFLQNLLRGVFRTLPNIYDGAFCE